MVIEYARQSPPDEYEDCHFCGVTLDVGDLISSGDDVLCQECYPLYKDASIPDGKFCELPDGYHCDWVEKGKCEKYNKKLTLDNNEYILIKCAECTA